MIGVIAGQQLVALRRQRILLALLATLLVMTALAGVIGWSSHRTIVRVYGDAVTLLDSRGRTAPPNPFDLKPALSLLSNMAIYIPLVGALLAVVLGHLSLADDESSGIGRLLFSRQLRRSSYLLGKLLGAGVVLAVILAACLLVSAVSLLVVNEQTPTGSELGRLALFYALSWGYLLVFALVGMVSLLLTRRRSLALLSAMGVWLVLTFAVPQLTSGLRPTASLNPVSDPVSTSQAFFDVTAHGRPFSVSEQYKEASARILETAAPEATSRTLLRVAPLVGLGAALALLAAGLVGRRDYSLGGADE